MATQLLVQVAQAPRRQKRHHMARAGCISAVAGREECRQVSEKGRAGIISMEVPHLRPRHFRIQLRRFSTPYGLLVDQPQHSMEITVLLGALWACISLRSCSQCRIALVQTLQLAVPIPR